MPVKIPDGLPAIKVLKRERISIISERDAFKQDIRPLQIAIINIMPEKCVAETQLLRLLSNSPLQVAITLLHPRSHVSKNTPPEHLVKFYGNFDDVKGLRYDGLAITGAPVGTLDFEEVTYWRELQEVMDWSNSNVYSSLHLCWGAFAGLNYHYGVPKYVLPEKMFGVFQHRVVKRRNALVNGFDDNFLVPHSRYSCLRREDLIKIDSVEILSESDVAGVYLVSAKNNRRVFVTGHPEYEELDLKTQYVRDQGKGLPISIPVNYFPDNNPSRRPLEVRWRAHANLLFGNWLNDVYQNTPFNLEDLRPIV